MSVSAIPSSALFTPQNIQATFQTLQQEFQLLGQDLQSGNLSEAQADFASLKDLGAQSSTTTSQNNSPITQGYNQLAKDLPSGNLPPLSGTLRRSSRISKINPRQARLRHRSHTVTIMAANPAGSVNRSTSSAPRCRRAISPPRTRHTLR